MLRPFYLAAFLLIALVFGFNNNRTDRMDWLILFPVVILIATAFQYLRLRFTKLTADGTRIRYQTGVLSRSTRTMELAKVQDVMVNQTLFQRFLGIGDISIETAGETSALTMKNVDHPQDIAEFLLGSARR